MDPYAEGPLYCPEQIKIPGHLPGLLKDYTKAAIRTQPADLLKWSADYFEALRTGEVPPVKERLECCVTDKSLGGLSKGALCILHKQIGLEEMIPVSTVRIKWENVGCHLSKLEELLVIGHFNQEELEWKKLLALACTALEKDLTKALTTLCGVLTRDAEGGPSRISVALFEELYRYLASVDREISVKQVDDVMQFLREESLRHDGCVGPREFLHNLCPKLGGFS